MTDPLATFEKDDKSAPILGSPYRINAALADRVNRLIAEAPADIRPDLEHAITSGYRNYEQQTVAYLHHLAGGGLAAHPGHSWHERLNGMAVDWNHVSPRAWGYLKDAAGRYGLGFPLGSADPYHMQPVETYAGGVNHVASAAAGTRVAAAPVPFAYDDIYPPDTPAPPVAKPKPAAPGAAPAATESALGNVILTPPTPMTTVPFRPIQGPHGTIGAPNLANGFRQALAAILRTR